MASESSGSSPEPSHHHRHRRKVCGVFGVYCYKLHTPMCAQKSSDHRKDKTDKTLNRKEKLLQELSAINKVIERKKQKKHSRRPPAGVM